MAITTYTAVGNREDLSDIITNIAPTETPLYSMFGKTTAKSTYHEWLEDDLNPPGANAKVEGAAFTIDTPTTRVRKGNYTQIFSKGYGVSGTQEAVLKAGIKSEIAYQMAKAMKEIARDVEYAIINNAAANAGSATVARQMGGIQAFVSTNVLANAGTPRPLTETLLNDGLQMAWEAGGSPDVVVVNGTNKRTISGFTAGLTKEIAAKDKRLVASVDVYESDFGLVRVVANRWMPANKVFILEKSRFKTAYLRPFKQEEVAKTADKVERVVVGELTLEVRAEKANAIIADIG
ncbi:MAG: phage head protein [Aquificota bacterium]|nr:MAG: phage head protein [Aquificota bacterium]